MADDEDAPRIHAMALLNLDDQVIEEGNVVAARTGASATIGRRAPRSPAVLVDDPVRKGVEEPICFASRGKMEEVFPAAGAVAVEVDDEGNAALPARGRHHDACRPPVDDETV